MNSINRIGGLLLNCVTLYLAFGLQAQDWPQWRGINRDAKASAFTAPQTWPKELAQKWKVNVGLGDATPALAGGKLYIFARQEGSEVTLCLNAASGKELWKDKYDTQAATEPMGRHPGPRSSPAVATGKVVTYGVRGTISCLDAATGKLLWRKEKDDAIGSWPKFFTSSSPLVADGLCIAQLGGEDKGGIVAFDLASGEVKWKWTDDGTGYASPILLTVDGVKMVVALTAKNIVGLKESDGKLLWEASFPVKGMAYNAATPIIEGSTVIYAGSGRGTKAVKIEKSGDAFTAKELWSNPDNGVQFNTPVLKSGQLYGISQKGDLFCLSAADGKTLWSTALGGKDFGSVVEAGPVLLALVPKGELSVFEPSDKEFKKVAGYKVASTDTYAYPIPAGNGIYVKDQDSVTFWALE
jgi:outer membrane protein assembly factor BamB